MDLYKVNYSYIDRECRKVHGWKITLAPSSKEAENKFLRNYPEVARATAKARLHT